MTLRESWYRVLKRMRARSRRSKRRIAIKYRTAQATGEAAELTRAESRIVFDRMSRRQLGMSADEFLRRLDLGDLPDTPEVHHLTVLAGGPQTR